MASFFALLASLGAGLFLGLAMISESPADILYYLLLLADLFQ